MTRAVVFLDLDGTLIEPSRGIFACIRHALGALGEASPDDESLRHWVGPPLRDSFATFLGDDRADAAISAYRERYGAVGWRECTLYPGIVDTLAALVRAGYSLVVATSKPGVYATQIIRHHGLDELLAEVCGAELDGRRSHKDELLAFANRRHGGRGIAMLGDRRYDIEGAKANGLAAIGAGWGFGSPDELTGAGADLVLDTPGELPGALSTLDPGRHQGGLPTPRR